MNISERLALLLKEKNITANALSKKTGVPQPTIHKILEGKTTNPGINTISALAKGLDTTIFNLMLYISDEEAEHIYDSEGMTLKERRTGSHEIFKRKIEVQYKAPLLSWVQAGNMTQIKDEELNEWYYYPGKAANDHIFCLRVEGESMEPKYQDGDIVFVDPDKAYNNGSTVIVVDDDYPEGSYATMKKLVMDGPKKYLKPLNPEWPGPKFIDFTNTMRIVGVVIGKFVKE
ncbi:helix-turn-helix domain-containing protein [Succinivibrio dextrinosolvens]|uniref:SOS-response transcriptional repressor LexA (RecA-mediated autopeptidase) n=1 Tax=Succinivibrio dextrinosolvens TaxID=83771 RepID=A0A662Z5Z6_9GAMM|nr:XRE family transcriptional regulator [Succinivibrio dextrinosolvens]SFJ74948.1 SOS-response transcriptional repressor LexA (RecA-mediated autopeptidase) [Succinivibrio dextrinosolvens]